MKTLNHLILHKQIFLWIVLVTGLVLLIPLIAMQFTNAVNWSAFDFAAAGILLSGGSSLFVLVARKLARKYWLAAGIVIAIALLYIWAELSVGVFTTLGS